MIRLVAPNPDLLARLGAPQMCAVPTDTPIDPQGVFNEIPMAGPYYIARYLPRQGVVLAANPNYHGSRPRHFARIELSVGIPIARAIAAVTAGTADNVSLGSDSTLSAAGQPRSPDSPHSTGPAAPLREREGSGTSATSRPTSRTSCSTRTGRCSPAPACARRSVTRSTAGLWRLSTRRSPCIRQITTCHRGCRDTAPSTSTP